MKDQTSLQIGTTGLLGYEMKRRTFGSGVQRSRSQEAEIGQTREHDISKTDEKNFVANKIGTNGSRDKWMNGQVLGSGRHMTL